MWNVNYQYQKIYAMYHTAFKLNYVIKYPEQWSFIFGTTNGPKVAKAI